MLAFNNYEQRRKLNLYYKLNTTLKYVTFAKACESKHQFSFPDVLVVKRYSYVITKV